MCDTATVLKWSCAAKRISTTVSPADGSKTTPNCSAAHRSAKYNDRICARVMHLTKRLLHWVNNNPVNAVCLLHLLMSCTQNFIRTDGRLCHIPTNRWRHIHRFQPVPAWRTGIMSVLWLFVCLLACVCVCLLRRHTFLPVFIVIFIIKGNYGFNTIFIFFIVCRSWMRLVLWEVYAAYKKSMDTMGVIQGNVIIMSWLY